jgi:hypothetical protein
MNRAIVLVNQIFGFVTQSSDKPSTPPVSQDKFLNKTWKRRRRTSDAKEKAPPFKGIKRGDIMSAIRKPTIPANIIEIHQGI